MSIWKTLGINATQEAQEIKKAYAKKLKTLDLSRDQAAFQQLRQAFETALRRSQQAEEEPEEEDAPSAFFRPTSPSPTPEDQIPPGADPGEKTEPLAEGPSPYDPRREIAGVADEITGLLVEKKEREAVTLLEQALLKEDFGRLEARWFLLEVLLNRLYAFEGNLPVFFCLNLVRVYRLKNESKKDFSGEYDMIENLLLIAELQKIFDESAKEKKKNLYSRAAWVLRRPYQPFLAYFPLPPQKLCHPLGELIDHMERFTKDAAGFGLDPRTVERWKQKIHRWLHPFQPKALFLSPWPWLLTSALVYTRIFPWLIRHEEDDMITSLGLIFIWLLGIGSFFNETGVYLNGILKKINFHVPRWLSIIFYCLLTVGILGLFWAGKSTDSTRQVIIFVSIIVIRVFVSPRMKKKKK